MLEITQCEERDLAAACAIMTEAAHWLLQRETPLWQPAELTPDKMQPYVLRKQMFLAKLGSEPVGTIILQDEDPLFWPEVEAGTSLFFHKLAIRRKVASQGIASALIHFANQTAIERSRSFLRMDCSAKHPRLRLFYEGHGFQFVDQRNVGPWTVDRLCKKAL